jgi:hypothetical protein
VTIINEINNKNLPENINYSFYISSAQKIVNIFKQKQLSLF